MSNIKSKAKILRELLNGDKLVVVAGAHDGISAKIAEKNGFHAIWASGLGVSAVQTVPDASILTMTDFLNYAIIMNESTNLPVIADVDSGYGNIHNVIRLVRKYESSGIAGICIEDKVYPKLNSFDNGKQLLVSVEEFQAKIKAAKYTQKDPDFLVIARVEALIAGLGQEEAYYRAKSYAEAGADAILIHSKQKDPSEIIKFVSRWDLDVPIVAVPTKYPNITMNELETIGVKMVIYANQALRGSVNAMDHVLKSIMKEKSTQAIEGEIVTIDEIFNLQEVPAMKEIEKLLYDKVFEKTK